MLNCQTVTVKQRSLKSASWCDVIADEIHDTKGRGDTREQSECNETGKKMKEDSENTETCTEPCFNMSCYLEVL